MNSRDVMEFAGGCALVAVVVWLMWAFCKLTPDQYSGEADAYMEQVRQSEGGAS